MNIVFLVDTQYKMRILFFLCLVLLDNWSVSALESNGTFGENVNGDGLIKLGRKLHKPMLTLIGMAIQNLHPCGEWTPWTPCDASRPGYFGSQTRTRTCLTTDALSSKPGPSEIDNKVCEGEGSCPLTYNLTSNGFCLKLNSTQVNHAEAEKQCELEGGYLIHIDSQQKYDNVKSVIAGFNYHVHIDGKRKDASSPWEYKYGSQTTFMNWHTGYPKNQKDYLCLVLDIISKNQFDYQCPYNTAFMCELVMK